MSKELNQLDANELDCLFTSISADPDHVAETLFPDQPGARRDVTKKIGEWAIHHKLVLDYHEEGKGDVAIVFEKVCDRIWRHLPDYARRVKLKFEDVN